MEKSAFNVKLGDLCHYSMLDKSEIQFEKNRFPFCALLQVMDILSDKATGTSRWEERFMPRVSLYLFDKKKFSPHITIIRRANGTLSREAADEIAESAITEQGGVSMTVDHISLMRSDRGKYGMIYTEL